MNKREWPLVVFTLAGQAAAGLAIFLLLPVYATAGRASDPILGPVRSGAAFAVFLCAAAAAAISVFHLGRGLRAPRSVVNVRASWLSREILALGVFLAAAGVLVIAEDRGGATDLRMALALLAAAAGMIFVFCMARIYMIPAVPEWNSPATPIAFFSSAAVLGALLAPLVRDFSASRVTANDPLIGCAAMGAALLAALLYAPRFGLFAKRDSSSPFRPDPKLSVVFAGRIALLVLAIGLGIVSIFAPIIADAVSGASLSAALGSEVLGRFLFYALPRNL